MDIIFMWILGMLVIVEAVVIYYLVNKAKIVAAEAEVKTKIAALEVQLANLAKKVEAAAIAEEKKIANTFKKDQVDATAIVQSVEKQVITGAEGVAKQVATDVQTAENKAGVVTATVQADVKQAQTTVAEVKADVAKVETTVQAVEKKA